MDRARLDEVTVAFRRVAEVDAAGGYAPVYQRMAAGAATDTELLAIAAAAKPGQYPPNLLLAAAQYLLIGCPDDPLCRFYPVLSGLPASDDDPYPALRDFVLAHRDQITELVATRLVQTNEPARSACLYPALLTAQRLGGNRPLALIEVGPSAGLTLVPDRYAYDYRTSEGGPATRYGDPASPLVLRCAVRGPVVPPLSGRLSVAWRVGVDLNPLNLAAPDDLRWLRALVWPDHPQRARRLELAARAAVRGPLPRIHQGDAAELLGGLVAQAPPDTTLVVFHSSVLAHFTPPARSALRDRLRELSMRRAIIWLRNEPRQDDQPRVRLTRLVGGVAQARYGLAHCHPHGGWLEWVLQSGQE